MDHCTEFKDHGDNQGKGMAMKWQWHITSFIWASYGQLCVRGEVPHSRRPSRDHDIEPSPRRERG